MENNTKVTMPLENGTRMITEEEKKAIQEMQDLKRDLKMQSKNQLIGTVMNLIGVCVEQMRINKQLNEIMKQNLKNQGESLENSSNNADSITAAAE